MRCNCLQPYGPRVRAQGLAKILILLTIPHKNRYWVTENKHSQPLLRHETCSIILVPSYLYFVSLTIWTALLNKDWYLNEMNITLPSPTLPLGYTFRFLRWKLGKFIDRLGHTILLGSYSLMFIGAKKGPGRCSHIGQGLAYTIV